MRIVATLGVWLCLLLPSGAQDSPGSWRSLRGSDAFTWASNRLSFAAGALQTSGKNRAGLSHVFQVSPPYRMSGIRLLFANFFVEPSGTAHPEQCPGNAKTIDFATVFVKGAAYPVTFHDTTSTSIDDCDFVWSDPLLDHSGKPLVLTSDTPYYIRSSQSVMAGGRLTFGSDYASFLPRASNATLGDGVEYTGEPQFDKRLAGVVAATGNGSGFVGPAMAIGQGWDGSPVYLIVGDSIAAGNNDLAFSVSDRGVVGYAARALDDRSRSPRYNFVNLALPGTRAQTQSSTAPGEFALRDRVLRSIPNRPFNRILSEMGQNGLKPLGEFKGVMGRWWSFLHGLCPDCRIVQTTYLPHARDIANSFWTTLDGQESVGSLDGYPAGMRWLANRWLADETDLPPYVRVVDVTPAFVDRLKPWLWRVSNGSWTLKEGIPSGARDVSLTGSQPPTLGDWLVLDAGTARAETRQILQVGQGPAWSVQFAVSLAHAHEAGSTFQDAGTGDGTHPGSSGHRAAAEILIKAKSSGILR